MSNLESEFIKEFKEEVGKFVVKDITKVPLPNDVSSWKVRHEEGFLVKAIEDEYYKKLNGTNVWRLPKNAVAKKRKIDRATRYYMRDSEGNFVYEEVKVPTKSIVVTSDVQLGLPYGYKAEGFGYVDCVVVNGTRIYMYIVPKKYLYPVHQTALVVSVKNMKNFEGVGYNTWRMGVIYLHIIPYNPNAMYTGSRILSTKVGMDYSNEIMRIVKMWQEVGFIPNIKICESSNGNLVTKMLDPGVSDYIPVDILSLGDKEIYGSSEEQV